MLLVDGANVVGSRPDGWWRDRAAAARRLVDALRTAVSEGRLEPPVVIVLEGAARAGCDEGDDGDVRVVHASASGDDALVDVAADADRPVLLVTADRALRSRAEAVGAQCVGPSWLYERLDVTGTQE